VAEAPREGTGAPPVERELKLLGGEGFSRVALLEVLGATPGVRLGEARTVQVHDVYLDTRGRALARAGLSARWRRKDRRGSLQVKPVLLVSGLVLERVELHRDLARGEDAAAALHALLERELAVRLDGKLAPEVELRARREVILVEAGEGEEACEAELSLDQVTAARPGVRGGPRFLEVELELLRGSVPAFDALCQQIAATPDLSASKGSKHRRALELLGRSPPPLAPPPPTLAPLLPADPAARQICAAQLGAIRGYEGGARLGLDPEYLHKMRVATRRLRAALRALGECFEVRARRWLLGELRWLAGALGAVRDLDVQLLSLEERAARLGQEPREGWEELRAVLRARRDAARAALLAALSAPRYARLLERADALFASVPRRRPSHPGAQPVVELAAAILKKRARNVVRAARACRADPAPAALHALRIEGKKLRYACEFFGSLYDARFAEGVTRLEAFQDVLGLFQDGIVAGALVSELLDEALSRGASGPYLYVLGALAAASRLGAEAAGSSLAAAYEQLGKARGVRRLARQARERAGEVRRALAIAGPLPGGAVVNN